MDPQNQPQVQQPPLQQEQAQLAPEAVDSVKTTNCSEY